MVTPISLVAIATAILTGLGSGAANMGNCCRMCHILIRIFESEFNWSELSVINWCCEDDDTCLFKASHYRYSSNCEWHYLRNCGIRIKY